METVIMKEQSEYINNDCYLNLIGAVINQVIKDLRISKERIGTNPQEKGLLIYYERTAREFIFGKRKLEEFLHTFGVEEYINAGFIRKYAEDPKRFEELFKRMEIDNWNEKKSQYEEDRKYRKDGST